MEGEFGIVKTEDGNLRIQDLNKFYSALKQKNNNVNLLRDYQEDATS